MNRRSFSKQIIKNIGSYVLLSHLSKADLFAKSVRPITDHWLKALNEISLDLKKGGISPLVWQNQVENLYNEVPLDDLINLLDFERFVKNFEYPNKGVNTKVVRFPSMIGLPDKLAFYSKIFGMKKNRAIIPHGHINMASCHYVLNGEVSLKQYDKLDETDTHMIIQPTIDLIAQPGSYSSISDDRNNVHWLRANTDLAHTFDVIVLDISGKPYDVNNIDPKSANRELNGNLMVKKISVEEGLEKYGFDSHH